MINQRNERLNKNKEQKKLQQHDNYFFGGFSLTFLIDKQQQFRVQNV